MSGTRPRPDRMRCLMQRARFRQSCSRVIWTRVGSQCSSVRRSSKRMQMPLCCHCNPICKCLQRDIVVTIIYSVPMTLLHGPQKIRHGYAPDSTQRKKLTSKKARKFNHTTQRINDPLTTVKSFFITESWLMP